MPKSGEVELGCSLETLRPQLPLVFLTAHQQDEQNLVAHGYVCLRKPLFLSELDLTVMATLERKRVMARISRL
jgi:CheY-like chemotaxis protein